MAPLTKDSVELANSAADTAAPQVAQVAQVVHHNAPAAGSSSGLRTDAVSLEVAVKVHGSRVVDTTRGSSPQTEPFEEQTTTMIVFPQGAVLRMSTAVNVGQMLVLTNTKTKQDSICRVVKVRPNTNLASYVEVEFTHAQPGYWGVRFVSDEPVAAPKPAPSPSIVEAQLRPPFAPATRPPAAITPAKDVKPATVAPTSETFVPAPRPESSFISIGSQETVQDAASATLTTKPVPSFEKRPERVVPPAPRHAPNIVPPVAAAPVEPVEIPAPPPALTPALSMAELQGDEDSESAAAIAVQAISDAKHETPAAASPAPAAPAREIFGNFGGITSASQSASSDAFGARLDGSLGSSTAQDPGASQNWLLIAACISVLVAGLAAGIFYFRQHPGGSTTSGAAAHPAVTASQSVQSASSQMPAITPPNQPYMPGASTTNLAAQPHTVSASPITVTPNPAPANAAKDSPSPAKPASPSVTSDMMSNSLTARPTTSARGDEGQSAAAPAIDPSVSASGNTALQGIAASDPSALPPPEITPEGPVKIGGVVKEPKLISSVMPQYPSAARQSGIEGDVVVQTTVDKSGAVVKMHVVSGPTALRASALEALRHWKYEPSRLNGEPVEIQMQVTIRFRK